MDTAGEGTSKKGQHRPGSGKRPARKRAPQTRKTASVSRLIQQLRKTVFPDPETQATRRQVLHKTKAYIQELEATLESLLKMRGNFQMEDSGSYSLEDVKEEYIQMYYSNDQGASVSDIELDSMDWCLQSEFPQDLEQVVEELRLNDSLPSLSTPDVQDFERYLHFYKQTVDLLIENRVVSPEQVTHPVVSKAVCSLWQDLLQEGKANSYQYGIPQASSTPCSLTYPTDAGSTSGGIRDSGAESQEATSSFLSSTPEEILFEDAFDVTSSFLDQNLSTSSPRSSAHGSPTWESPEGESRLFQRITDFLRTRLSLNTQSAVLHCDYESVLLRCTETFDDEDDL